jgi:hypothetical protein
MHRKSKLLLTTLALSSFQAVAQIDISLINQGSLTEPISIVNCTLENGSATECYELKFFANDVNDDGPFCPQTINDIGGLGIYEPGNAGTNVGLAAIDANLLNIIEADGFDIVQANGTVNLNVPGSGTPPSPGTSYCLQAEPDNDLELVYLIPINPENLATPNTIQPVEQLGLSLHGIPFKGNPPGVIGGGPGGPGGGPGGGSDVTMPALDACGGHHDPGGYYHWHMIANSTNEVLSDLQITAVTCTGFPQDASALMGFAMDGYPIYGQFESGSSLPVGLDECNGHFSVTNEYPSGVYHYHAVQGTAPNIPPCLKGASANNNFTYSFHPNTVSIEEQSTENPTNIFPNPAMGRIVIIHTSATELMVFDNSGRQVVDAEIRKVANGFEIDTETMAAGVYHLMIEVDGGIFSKKLIVNH